MRKIGFTGTQQGMTEGQKDALRELLKQLLYQHGELHHGDCIGADFEAATIARSMGFRIVGHPPKEARKRAFFPSDAEFQEDEYLKRNHAIVDATDLLIAAPKEVIETLRSGTWATVRYARKRNKGVRLVLPPLRAKTEFDVDMR